MGLLDSTAQEPRSKVLQWSIFGVGLAMFVAVLIWYLLRFQEEKQVVAEFLQALAAGDTRRAYQLWQPNPSYTYELFLEDWGPQGEFGPVRSFRITAAVRPRRASGVVIAVEVSPKAPFDGSDPAVKEVKIWVEFRDKSLGFAPPLARW